MGYGVWGMGFKFLPFQRQTSHPTPHTEYEFEYEYDNP